MQTKLDGVKGIYFDLDDTLCGYWQAARHGLRRTFDDHPIDGRTTEEMILLWSEVFGGLSSEVGSPRWYPLYCESGEHTRVEQMRRVLARVEVFDEALAQALSSSYYVERHAALELFPESLQVLKSLSGLFPLGLITNGPADIQRQEIEKLQIGSFFEHVFIEGEMRMGKPRPEVMARAREAMGLEPREILMVGNSYKYDMVPAVDAGWRTAWIRRPSDVSLSSTTGRPEQRPSGGPVPDLEITSLVEVLAALNGARLSPSS